MSLDFGNENTNKNICFTVPDLKPLLNQLKTPDLSNIKLPKLGLPSFGNLNFGTSNLSIQTPKINLPNIPDINAKLNFGGIDNLKNKISALKIPTTICINVGGDYNFESIFTQIGDVLNALVPKIPSTEIPALLESGRFSIIPPLLINPTLPIDLTIEQALAIVKDKCLSSLLDSLRNIDPLERLKKLLEIASDLCSKMLFSQLRDVIDEIQKTQMELISNALNTITDPLEKIAKLIDMANDALNAGSYELLDEISKLLGSTQYEALLDYLDKLDPTVAISALLSEIRNLVTLKNFAPINQLLSILQALNAKLKGLSELASTAINLPELSIDQLQSEIDRLLQLDDIFGIQRLLSDFMRAKYATINELRKLSPNQFLMQALPMLNSALKNMELGLFDAIIKSLADSLCNINTSTSTT